VVTARRVVAGFRKDDYIHSDDAGDKKGYYAS
jgi:hypothetical protein